MKFGLNNKVTAGSCCMCVCSGKHTSVYIQWDEVVPGLSTVINTLTVPPQHCFIHLLMVGYLNANNSDARHCIIAHFF